MNLKTVPISRTNSFKGTRFKSLKASKRTKKLMATEIKLQAEVKLFKMPTINTLELKMKLGHRKKMFRKAIQAPVFSRLISTCSKSIGLPRAKKAEISLGFCPRVKIACPSSRQKLCRILSRTCGESPAVSSFTTSS